MPSFAHDLRYGFPSAKKQLQRDGLGELDDFIVLLRRRSALEEYCSKELEKISHAPGQGSAEDGTVHAATRAVRVLFMNEAAQRRQLAASLVEDCVNPLVAFRERLTTGTTSIVASEETARRTLKTAEATYLRTHKRAVALHKDARAAVEKLHAALSAAGFDASRAADAQRLDGLDAASSTPAIAADPAASAAYATAKDASTSAPSVTAATASMSSALPPVAAAAAPALSLFGARVKSLFSSAAASAAAAPPAAPAPAASPLAAASTTSAGSAPTAMSAASVAFSATAAASASATSAADRAMRRVREAADAATMKDEAYSTAARECRLEWGALQTRVAACEQEVQQALARAEQLERERLADMQQVVRKLAVYVSSLLANMQYDVQALAKYAEDAEVDNDVAAFIQAHAHELRPPAPYPPPPARSGSLDASAVLEDAMDGALSVTVRGSSVAAKSVQQCVRLLCSGVRLSDMEMQQTVRWIREDVGAAGAFVQALEGQRGRGIELPARAFDQLGCLLCTVVEEAHGRSDVRTLRAIVVISQTFQADGPLFEQHAGNARAVSAPPVPDPVGGADGDLAGVVAGMVAADVVAADRVVADVSVYLPGEHAAGAGSSLGPAADGSAEGASMGTAITDAVLNGGDSATGAANFAATADAAAADDATADVDSDAGATSGAADAAATEHAASVTNGTGADVAALDDDAGADNSASTVTSASIHARSQSLPPSIEDAVKVARAPRRPLRVPPAVAAAPDAPRLLAWVRHQGVWRDLSFWERALFDSLDSELEKLMRTGPTRETAEQEEALAAGQLSFFVLNMAAFGVPRADIEALVDSCANRVHLPDANRQALREQLGEFVAKCVSEQAEGE